MQNFAKEVQLSQWDAKFLQGVRNFSRGAHLPVDLAMSDESNSAPKIKK